jgi:triosephosphate isomerase
MAKILIFNWKMNPASLKEALVLAKISDQKNIVVAPPFVFIEEVQKKLKKAKLGAQDLFWEAGGAFTGEISSQELKKMGVKYVIVGHSERRHKLGETDEVIAKKIKAAVDGGLTPVLCVGETFTEKHTGQKEAVLKRQLKIGLSLISKPYPLNSIIIAYEPVWAIGTGNPETPESALETIQYIKKILNAKPYTLNPKVLYGGSVNSKNLLNYLKYKEVDGALVGGASLKKEEIKKMIQLITGH